MQQHLSAEAQSIVYLLSGAVTASILHMNLSALSCHNTSSDHHWWSVRQSDKAANGIRVSYRSGTDPTRMFVCWHTPASEAVNVWTQVCVCPLACMYVRAVSVTAPSCNSRFISKQRTREVKTAESQRMDPLTMMRPVVIGSLQPWHSSPNLAQ